MLVQRRQLIISNDNIPNATVSHLESIDSRQVLDAMPFEAMHELVRHYAVTAQCVDAVDAARDGVEFLGFAAGAPVTGENRLLRVERGTCC